MSSTWFISDLHLDQATRPHITAQFLSFLTSLEEQNASSLYILGDLFEYWIGDDILDHHLGDDFLPVIKGLSALEQTGCDVSFIHGNRDFLIGDVFAERAHCHLLDEHSLIQLNGEDVILLHGDTLCTDDHAYQQFRSVSRSEAWKAQFLGMTVEQRLAEAEKMRSKSREMTSQQAEAIMDVNEDQVAKLFQTYNTTTMIHGHTHRPAIHSHYQCQGRSAKRLVLGDWYDQLSSLESTENALKLIAHGDTQTIER